MYLYFLLSFATFSALKRSVLEEDKEMCEDCWSSGWVYKTEKGQLRSAVPKFWDENENISQIVI